MDNARFIPQILKTKAFWIGLCFIFISYLVFKHSSSHHEKGIAVSVAEAIRGNITPHFDTVGTANPDNTAIIKAQVNGQIINIAVKDGQEVTANQVLLTIDPKPYQAAVDQAAATLKKDQVQAKVAQDELGRYQKLVKRGYISKDFFDQIKGNAASALATVAADQAALDNAKIQLGYTQIKAPISGRLSKIAPNMGDIIKADDATVITTINQLKPMDVDFSLPAQHLPALLAARAANQKVQLTVTSSDDPGLKEAGQLTFIDNQVDPATGSIALKGMFDNASEKIWPGEFLKVHVQTAPIANAVLIPTIAIQQNQQQQNYVYVVDNKHHAHMRTITIGISSGKMTNVVEGLIAGEKVVIRGQFLLNDGSLVKEEK